MKIRLSKLVHWEKLKKNIFYLNNLKLFGYQFKKLKKKKLMIYN